MGEVGRGTKRKYTQKHPGKEKQRKKLKVVSHQQIN